MPTVPLSLSFVCRSIKKIPSEMILGYKESKSLTLNVKYPNTLMIPLLSVLFFHGSQSSFSKSLDLLDTFALVSGLLNSITKKLKPFGLAPVNVQKSPSSPRNQYYGPKIKYMHWEYGFQLSKILMHMSAFRKR